MNFLDADSLDENHGKDTRVCACMKRNEYVPKCHNPKNSTPIYFSSTQKLHFGILHNVSVLNQTLKYNICITENSVK